MFFGFVDRSNQLIFNIDSIFFIVLNLIFRCRNEMKWKNFLVFFSRWFFIYSIINWMESDGFYFGHELYFFGKNSGISTIMEDSLKKIVWCLVFMHPVHRLFTEILQYWQRTRNFPQLIAECDRYNSFGSWNRNRKKCDQNVIITLIIITKKNIILACKRQIACGRWKLFKLFISYVRCHGRNRCIVHVCG